MQQDALVFQGHVERGADLFRAAPLDVAHVDDGALEQVTSVPAAAGLTGIAAG